MPPAPSAASGAATSAGYLGPEGTFSEEALLASAVASAVTPIALETIRDAVMAVQERAVEWSIVPIENSIEGSVTVTLDTLAGEAGEVAIVGEVVLPVRHYLIAASESSLRSLTSRTASAVELAATTRARASGPCRKRVHWPGTWG